MKTKAFAAICIAILTIAILIVPCFASVDWSSYASANLLPLPYTSGTPGATLTTNGVTWTINDDGSITFSGTSTADVFFWLADITLEGGQYNYHSSITGTYTGLWVGGDQGGEGTFYASEGARYRFYLALQPNRTYDFTIKVMLNKTATAYPYQPYIQYYISQAENYVKNPFREATFTAMIEKTDDITIRTFTPTFFTNGVSLKPIYDYCQQNGYTTIDYLEITWPDTYTWDYTIFPLYISSPATNIDGLVYNQDGYANGLQVSEDAQNARPLLLQPETYIYYPTNVKKIRLEPIGTVNNLQYTSLSMNVEMYNAGFTAGYNEGAQANNQAIYNEGKADGYRNGFIEGKAEGLALSETGDWRSLISAVLEAPVNTFQSLFHFEILGMDMREAIGAILALCVILIIIKKVVL